MEFNHDLLKQDLDAVRDFFVNFAKSFGISPKKVGDRKLGFFEESYIRFRLHLVEMGPVKWFKTVIVFIGAIVLYFALFRHADAFMMIVTVFLFLWFYVWVWGEELGKEKKDGKQGLDKHVVTVVDNIVSVFKKEKKDDKKK